MLFPLEFEAYPANKDHQHLVNRECHVNVAGSEEMVGSVRGDKGVVTASGGGRAITHHRNKAIIVLQLRHDEIEVQLYPRLLPELPYPPAHAFHLELHLIEGLEDLMHILLPPRFRVLTAQDEGTARAGGDADN